MVFNCHLLILNKSNRQLLPQNNFLEHNFFFSVLSDNFKCPFDKIITNCNKYTILCQNSLYQKIIIQLTFSFRSNWFIQIICECRLVWQNQRYSATNRPRASYSANQTMKYSLNMTTEAPQSCWCVTVTDNICYQINKLKEYI